MAPPGHRSYRLTAIDMLRGLAIVVMAIDHWWWPPLYPLCRWVADGKRGAATGGSATFEPCA